MSDILTINIRRANPADATATAMLSAAVRPPSAMNTYFTSSRALAERRAHLANSSLVFTVALAAGRIIGQLEGAYGASEQDTPVVHGIEVHPDYQQFGVEGALITNFEQGAGAQADITLQAAPVREQEVLV